MSLFYPVFFSNIIIIYYINVYQYITHRDSFIRLINLPSDCNQKPTDGISPKYKFFYLYYLYNLYSIPNTYNL